MSGNIFYRVKNSERIKSGSLKAVKMEECIEFIIVRCRLGTALQKVTL